MNYFFTKLERNLTDERINFRINITFVFAVVIVFLYGLITLRFLVIQLQRRLGFFTQEKTYKDKHFPYILINQCRITSKHFFNSHTGDKKRMESEKVES